MSNSFGIVKDDIVEIEEIILPVNREELRLIKIGLFEISEFLDSPKLRELRQRVNSLAGKCIVKLPAESVFNDIAAELRMGKRPGNLEYIYTGEDL